jgi:hypothetical protein
MKKFSVLFGAFALGCAAVGAVEAGNGSHGGSPKPSRPASVVVEQDVTVQPGVVVKETVEVDGGAVKVTEEVDVVEAPVAGGPLGVGTVRKDARREKRATIAEAKAERRAGRFAKKAYEADHEAAVQEAVKKAYDAN